MPKLSQQAWQPVPAHVAYLAFLRAEWDKWPATTRFIDRSLIDAPNLADLAQNTLRTSLLLAIRSGLLHRIPLDTQWFEVRRLRREHLPELRVIGRCGWDDPKDRNELPAVARRRPLPLQKLPAAWDPPLLWGHDRNGPFTILEGNTRLVAFAGADPQAPLDIPCYVGLSKSPCAFHLPDPYKPK